jgi:hypothetical protein
LAFLKATHKLIELLHQQGEKPEMYLSDKAKELLEVEHLKKELKDK